MSQRIKFPSCYFRDGNRKIDHIIVYDIKATYNTSEALIIGAFMTKLREQGLELEEEYGVENEDKRFIKVHVPDRLIPDLAKTYGVVLMCQNPYYKNESRILIKWLQSLVTSPHPRHPVFQRAPASLSGEKPTEATDAERFIIANILMNQAECLALDGSNANLKNLIRDHIFEDAYPLHDTPHEWTHEGYLSDRQLLAKYWVSLRAMFKEQPLNLIEKYFGTEVAFYYAWMGHNIRMMIVASIPGALLMLGHVILMLAHVLIQPGKDEICSSDLILCPECLEEKLCPFVPLKKYCNQGRFAYVIDNYFLNWYTVLMSFWGIFSLAIWKRKEALLRLRWNLSGLKEDRTMRKSFIAHEPHTRISSVTNTQEYYFPYTVNIIRVTMSVALMFVVFLILILITFGIYAGRKTFVYYSRRSELDFLRENINWIDLTFTALVTAGIIMIVSLLYHPVAEKLTNLEVPRTEYQYQNRYIMKIFLFSTANNFFYIVYLAFFKGKFYTYPGDSKIFTTLGGLKAEDCNPASCIVDLATLMFTILVWKKIIALSRFLGLFYLKKLYKKTVKQCTSAPSPPSSMIAQWEKDYNLQQLSPNYIMKLYTEQILKYSCMVCFMAAFPLAPLLALITSLFELRTSASQLVKHNRRFLPKQVPDIGAWSHVVKIITFIGAFTNPLVLALNSDFVPKMLYYDKHGTISGFINSRFSAYAVSELKLEEDSEYNGLKVCYYRGNRYPPNSTRPYELTTDYWYEIAWKAFSFIILENVILLVYLIMYYSVPQIPRRVRVRLEFEQQELKAYRDLKTEI